VRFWLIKKKKWTNLTGQISPIGEILANFEISKILNILDWMILANFFQKNMGEIFTIIHENNIFFYFIRKAYFILLQ
jgi:hypothetical protein